VIAAPLATLAVVVTQAQPPAPGSDRGEEFGKTSPIALVVILLLGIATVLLIRSMNKRLRNVPASFDPPEPTADAAAPETEEGTTTAGAAGSGAGTAGSESSASQERQPPD
jgi:hypothetical protein